MQDNNISYFGKYLYTFCKHVQHLSKFACTVVVYSALENDVITNNVTSHKNRNVILLDVQHFGWQGN